MDLTKRVLVYLVLLIGLVTAVVLTRAEGRKALAMDVGKRVPATRVMKAEKLNAANSMGAGTAADVSAGSVKYVNNEEITAASAKGNGLILSDWIPAGRECSAAIEFRAKDKAVPPEFHPRMSHIIYVLEGSVTYVTGGTLVGPLNTANKETTRGTAIEGGETRQLSKGDFIIVPKGTNHWRKTLQSDLVYLMVSYR
jgi:quercetin dioxygenase-like cupin family protein